MRKFLLATIFLIAFFVISSEEPLVGGQPISEKANQAERKPSPKSSPSPTVNPMNIPSVENTAGQQNVAAQSAQAPISNEHRAVDTSALNLTDWLQVGINFLLLLVVVFQSYIANQQSKIMQKQVDDVVTTERAYIGFTELTISNLAEGQFPTLNVTWHNGGRTPAWHFRANPYLSIGEKPEPKGFFIDDDWNDIKASFLPAGEALTLSYPQQETGFKLLTTEMLDDLDKGKERLYAMINAVFVDYTGKTQSLEASAIFDKWDGKFIDLYEYSKSRQRKPG